ncbi:RrF2 family transcriptional regulator [Dethiosulfatarculus sandiegensis]|uniref:AsnC family transcriptional regulator n=1 Tax=Dethiosulfatarculus sandiegensis TaxID=1429043 RepID=A0A0D2JCC8_9BACT|nr:Rrf2 family transcriptional regulator [Dethiosulfatarculus sandiegensis]KIX15799.1 AsnC family transcriptional regulator [Dethiosulfatarculus sandiegensis]
MKISTRGRYGVRALLELAMQESNWPVALKTLAEKQDISVKYLEQLLIPLKGADLVKSVRGARGGYMLARPASQIVMHDILRALEGPLAVVECVDNPNDCGRVSQCVVHELWEEMSRLVRDYLNGITLEELAHRQQGREFKKAVNSQ